MRHRGGNVILLGFCQELGIRSVLMTESFHGQHLREELDLAPAPCYFRGPEPEVPKHLEPRLHIPG